MSQLAAHPLKEAMTDDEWRQLGSDVQRCKVSWPIGVEIVRDTIDPPRDVPMSHPKHPSNSHEKAPDPFNHQVGGNHYKDCKIQPVEYILANDLDFACGNVVKYVTRFKVKGNVQDLLKAKHYLELKLASLGETELPPFTVSDGK